MANPCTHRKFINKDAEPASEGCEQCIQAGDEWVQLRMCMTCGHVGCCDSSKNRHANEHYIETGHPIIKSHQSGENWKWCFIDEKMML